MEGLETVTTETVGEIRPFTPPAENGEDNGNGNGDAPLVAGEVITPEGELKANERVIKRSWKTATEKVGEVYKALTIIHTKNLWKLHLNADGKRKYTAFADYLFGEFGWDLDRTRALQIIKQTRPALLESGDLKQEDMPEERTRSAPEQTPTKAAKITITQLEKVLDAFRLRIPNVEAGPGRDDLDAIFDNLSSAISLAMNNLQTVIDDEEQRAADEKAANVEKVSPIKGE